MHFLSSILGFRDRVHIIAYDYNQSHAGSGKVFSLFLTARKQGPNLILFPFNRNNYKKQDEPS